MVLDDKASAFLLQVRQAMAASSGSPVSAETIPLEEVAAAVEASGGGFSSVLNEVAAATLSNSVSILILYISFLIRFFFLKSVSELDFDFYAIWICEHDLAVGSRFCALICLIGFCMICSSFLEFLFPLNFSSILLKFAGSG